MNGHVLTSHSPDPALSCQPVGLFSAKPPRFRSCSFNTHTHNENAKMRCHSIFFLKTVTAVLAHILVLVTLDCKTSCRVPSWNAGWNSVYEPGHVLGPQGMGVLLEVRPSRGELTRINTGRWGRSGQRAGHWAEVGAGRHSPAREGPASAWSPPLGASCRGGAPGGCGRPAAGPGLGPGAGCGGGPGAVRQQRPHRLPGGLRPG